MVLELKVRKIGNSLGVILPREALAHLGTAEGDSITATEGPEGGLHLSARKEEVARQLAVVEDLMKRYRNTLRELAK